MQAYSGEQTRTRNFEKTNETGQFWRMSEQRQSVENGIVVPPA